MDQTFDNVIAFLRQEIPMIVTSNARSLRKRGEWEAEVSVEGSKGLGGAPVTCSVVKAGELYHVWPHQLHGGHVMDDEKTEVKAATGVDTERELALAICESIHEAAHAAEWAAKKVKEDEVKAAKERCDAFSRQLQPFVKAIDKVGDRLKMLSYVMRRRRDCEKPPFDTVEDRRAAAKEIQTYDHWISGIHMASDVDEMIEYFLKGADGPQASRVIPHGAIELAWRKAYIALLIEARILQGAGLDDQAKVAEDAMQRLVENGI